MDGILASHGQDGADDTTARHVGKNGGGKIEVHGTSVI
jgi:hypothetical protein